MSELKKDILYHVMIDYDGTPKFGSLITLFSKTKNFFNNLYTKYIVPFMDYFLLCQYP